MAKIAFLFSGQGAQYPGMGADAYAVSSVARQIYKIADCKRPNTASQCFGAAKEELMQTINAQPCIFTVSLAWAAALRDAGIVANGAAGFSLGEISALTYGGAFSFDKGFDFICKRAQTMDECAAAKPGGMAAVLKLSNGMVEELCRQYSEVYPVNYNCPGQIAVAGTGAQLEEFIKDVSFAGGKALKLAVSGAFHTPFMEPASKVLTQELALSGAVPTVIPVYSNVTSQPFKLDMNELIAKQVMHPVRWQQTIENMIEDGFTHFIEVGVKKTLCDFVKKISERVTADFVENKESFERCVRLLKRA